MSKADEDRIQALEAKVARLEAQVGSLIGAADYSNQAIKTLIAWVESIQEEVQQ